MPNLKPGTFKRLNAFYLVFDLYHAYIHTHFDLRPSSAHELSMATVLLNTLMATYFAISVQY